MRSKRIEAVMSRMRNLASGADWCRIVNSATDVADVYLYDEIGYWGTTADEFCEQLRNITARQINLHINSPGGEVIDGLAIQSCLKQHNATVVTYVDGVAASAASFVALAGDEVLIDRNAIFMIHDAQWLCIGNARDMRETADLMDKLSDNIADIYAQKAGGLVSDWRELMLAETWYTGEEACAAGLCDGTTPTKKRRCDLDGMPDGAMDRARFDLAAMFRYAGREDAPAPRAVDRSRRDQDDPAWVPSPAPSSITVTTSGAAMVNVAWGDGVSDVATPRHGTATSDGSWDGPENERRLPSPMTVAVARRAYGWYDPDAVEDGEIPKSGCRFIHHEVGGDGSPGAANVTACRTGIGVLNGGRGGTTIPDADRRGVYNHLAKHLRDAGEEPPPLAPADVVDAVVVDEATDVDGPGDGGEQGPVEPAEPEAASAVVPEPAAQPAPIDIPPAADEPRAPDGDVPTETTVPPEPPEHSDAGAIDLWEALAARLTQPESVEDALARLRRAA